jgi:hypothetical protein
MNKPLCGRGLKSACRVVLSAAAFALALAYGASAKAERAPLRADVSPSARAAALKIGGAALRFEPNVGQFAPAARYVARGRAYALFLTADGATLALHRPTDDGSAARLESASDSQSVVTMKLRGAAPVEPRGISPLPGRSNYFVGNDRATWRSGVESFERVRYEGVLPGVDVEYYGTDGHELEYDFVLAPGTLPSSIEIEFEGVSRLEIAADGRALLHLEDGSRLEKEPPVAYQMRGAKRIGVRAKYEMRSGRLGFLLGDYDASLPLVIDPILTYSTYFGGSSFDEAYGIAADAGGNTYIVGYTASTLFPTSSPEQPVHGGGTYDAFVVKLDPSGSKLIYSTYLGGNGADIAYAVATDALGNAYVAGLTSSTNFPTASALQSAKGGLQDAFISKLDGTGASLVYSTYLGGMGDDYARGIAVSNTGAAYLVGTTFSANFPKAAPLQAALSGDQDAFASEISPSGSSLAYSTYLGGNAAEYGNAIALDSAGEAYLVGSTTSSNFPIANARQPAHAGGNTDAFLSKLNPAGSALIYSTYLGGSSADEALGVSVAGDNAIVVGDTFSTNFPLTVAAQPVPGGSSHSDAFITRFDASGAGLVFSTYFGGSGNDVAAAVANDSAGNAYVVGLTDSPDLMLTTPLDGQSTYRGGGDAFVLALPPSGARFAYSSYLGGAAEDHGAGVTVAVGTTFIVGSTHSSDFPRVSPIINGLVGAQDGFVAKLPSIQAAAVAVAAPALGSWVAFALLSFLLLATSLVLVARRERSSSPLQ